MKNYSCTEAPIKLYGLCKETLPEHFYRLPVALMDKLGGWIKDRALLPMGGRVRFRTDSEKIVIKTTLKTNKIDWAVPLSCSANSTVLIGETKNMRLAGLAGSHDYSTLYSEGTIKKKAGVMEDVTIYLERNEILEKMEIEIDDGARIEEPTPYQIEKPIVFYGSSITEGGCATRTANAYTALVSSWLDADFYNMGFSGAAKGEIEVAEYIASLDMSAFVYDYDHNAPSAEHLMNTHEPFFKYIRAAKPELPILMLSRPGMDDFPDDTNARESIIRRTYENALAAGDKNVAFIQGRELFGAGERINCTIEGCHPNDLGFMRMAKRIYPELKKLMKA
ncbi:MAG: SGNH/GDSL hydrolase family protein [Eubacteriales bacterium]|nr:SGNH/GDSL hydrolase family protein [Eubacteriales bacterium]MDD3882144.1 SGNH/GDSL hydrolase family protein [Eubacteriales bacterium]MDD4513249.1 SGNH/GDSL hydrolase family protein [Eubacteriales bacterium]